MTNRKRLTQEERDKEKFILQMMYLLQAPTFGMPMWVDTMSKHKDEITLERFRHHREIFETQHAPSMRPCYESPRLRWRCR